MEILKAAGADLNFARVDGATALDLAIDQEHSETVLWPKSEIVRPSDLFRHKRRQDLSQYLHECLVVILSAFSDFSWLPGTLSVLI